MWIVRMCGNVIHRDTASFYNMNIHKLRMLYIGEILQVAAVEYPLQADNLHWSLKFRSLANGKFAKFRFC